MSEAVPSPLRKWRLERKLSLDGLCDLFAERGYRKPSAAKLSRIERGQPIPLDMLAVIKGVTGLATRDLRPDIVELVGGDQ